MLLLNLLSLACLAKTSLIQHVEGRNNTESQVPFGNEFDVRATYKDQNLVLHWPKVPKTNALLKYCYEICSQNCISNRDWSTGVCKLQTDGRSCKTNSFSNFFRGSIRLVVIDRNAINNSQECREELCIKSNRCNVSRISKQVLFLRKLEFYSTFSAPLLEVKVGNTSVAVEAKLVNSELHCEYRVIEFTFSLEMNDSPVGNAPYIITKSKNLTRKNWKCDEESASVNEQFINLIPNKSYNLTAFYSINSDDIYDPKSDETVYPIKTKPINTKVKLDPYGFNSYLLIAIILPTAIILIILITIAYCYAKKIYGIQYDLPEFLKILQGEFQEYCNKDEIGFKTTSESKEIPDVYKPLSFPRELPEMKPTELILSNLKENNEELDANENISVSSGYLDKNTKSNAFSCDGEFMQTVSNVINCSGKIDASQTCLPDTNSDDTKEKQSKEVSHLLRPTLAAFENPSKGRFQNSHHKIPGKEVEEIFTGRFREISEVNDAYKSKSSFIL